MSNSQPIIELQPSIDGLFAGMPLGIWQDIMLQLSLADLTNLLNTCRTFSRLRQYVFHKHCSLASEAFDRKQDYITIYRQEQKSVKKTVDKILFGDRIDSKSANHKEFLKICREGKRDLVQKILTLNYENQRWYIRQSSLVNDSYYPHIVNTLIKHAHYDLLSDIICFKHSISVDEKNRDDTLLQRLLMLYKTDPCIALERTIITIVNQFAERYKFSDSLISYAISVNANHVANLFLQTRIIIELRIQAYLAVDEERPLQFKPIQMLLDRLSDLKTPKYHYPHSSPLHIAAKLGELALFKPLFNHPYFDPLSFDINGYTPLHVILENAEAFDINHDDEHTLSPTIHECINTAMQLYIERYGESVLTKLTLDNKTLLDVAADSFRFEAIQCCLNYPIIDVNCIFSGTSAMHRLFGYGESAKSCLQILLDDERIDFSMRDPSTQQTYLMRAVSINFEALSVELISSLLDANQQRPPHMRFDINAIDSDGNTAIHTVVKNSSGKAHDARNSAILKTLLHHGADINQLNQEGLTVAHLAISCSTTVILDAILACDNFDINRGSGSTGGNLLHFAINHPRTQHAKWYPGIHNPTEEYIFLLLKHPNIDLSYTNGKSILQTIVKGYFTEDVRNKLLFALIQCNKKLPAQRQYNINYPDENGQTIMHYLFDDQFLFIQPHEMVMTLLVTHPGIDLNTHKTDTITLLEYALHSGTYVKKRKLVETILEQPSVDISGVAKVVRLINLDISVIQRVLDHPHLTQKDFQRLMRQFFEDASKRCRFESIINHVIEVISLESVKSSHGWRSCDPARNFITHVLRWESPNNINVPVMIKAGLPCETFIQSSSTISPSIDEYRKQILLDYTLIRAISAEHDGRAMWKIYQKRHQQPYTFQFCIGVNNGAIDNTPITSACRQAIFHLVKIKNPLRIGLCSLLSKFCEHPLISKKHRHAGSKLLLDILAAKDIDTMKDVIVSGLQTEDEKNKFFSKKRDYHNQSPLRKEGKGIRLLIKNISFRQALEGCLQLLDQYQLQLTTVELAEDNLASDNRYDCPFHSSGT